MSSFLGPGVNIPGRPPKLTVIKGSGTHINDTQRTGVINSYNVSNSTFHNSYNDCSRVDNAPHDYVKPTPGDGRHPISATGPNGVNPLNPAPILHAHLEEVQRTAEGIPRHLPPGTVEHNINSRNIHSNIMNENDVDSPQRPGVPHVQSDPGTGNPPSNPTRPPMTHCGGQTAASYPDDLTRLSQQGTPNPRLAAQHAAASSGDGLELVNGVRVRVEVKKDPYIHDEGHTVVNIDLYNFTGNIVLNSLNNEPTVNHAP